MGDAVDDQRIDPPEVVVGEYRGLQLVVAPTDSEHCGYLEEARQHRLVVQRCGACGMLRGAIGAACPFCTSPDWSWHAVSGRGVIYSYQIVTQAVHPAFADWAPYPVVLVELAEDPGLRLVGGIADCAPDRLRIGLAVQVWFENAGDGLWLPQWRPADPATGASGP